VSPGSPGVLVGMGRTVETEFGTHEVVGMDALAEMVKDDYVGACEVLESGPEAARLRLSPEAFGRRDGSPPVTFELTPFVALSCGEEVGRPVDLVLVTRCDGSWDEVPVLVSPVPSAIIALALR